MRTVPKMKVWQIMVTDDLAERIGWVTEERDCARSEAVRHLLHVATRDLQPPERKYRKDVEATDAEWQAWKDAAEELGVSLDQLIRKSMNQVVRRVFSAV